MKQLLALVILLMRVLLLFGQWEEIPELQYEQLSDHWLEQFYAQMQDKGTQLRGNSRIRLGDEEVSAFIASVYRDSSFTMNANLYWEDEQALAGFQAAYEDFGADSKSLVIGSMRCNWALGNILGKSTDSSGLFAVTKATSPTRAALQGISGSMRRGNFSASIIASAQKRGATLRDGQISSLSKNRQHTMSRVGEEIVAGIIQYQQPTVSLGILAYYQAYPRDFADSELLQRLLAYSIFGKYSTAMHSLSSELSLIGRHPALKLEAMLRLNKLQQKLSLAYFEGAQLPAYASRATLLSNQGKTQELRYELHYHPQTELDFSISQALCRHNSSLQKQSWQQRSILALAWQPSATAIRIQFTRLDKELLLETDSTYVSSLPVHYRAQLNLEQQISPALAWEMQFRYHYLEKLKSNNNSFYWQNSLSWTHSALQLSTGIKTWQSVRTLILPDAEQGLPEGFSSVSSDDNRIFIKTAFRLARIRMAAELQQSWLTGWRGIYLSLGS